MQSAQATARQTALTPSYLPRFLSSFSATSTHVLLVTLHHLNVLLDYEDLFYIASCLII